MEPEFQAQLREFARKEEIRKIFDKVFDERTIQAVHHLATAGHIDALEFLISTGKEAHVFRAVDESGNFRAVKIYKIEATDFRNMKPYLEGDKRFKEIGHGKRDLIYAWTRKEFRNLEKFNEAGVKVPLPYAFKENVLVMEFIGKKGEAAKTLKNNPVKDFKKLYEEICLEMARMIEKSQLVHADLSEYNILNRNEEPVIIDCGQAVLTSHPKAKEFFERDVKNMAAFFSKKGLKKSFKEMYLDIKEKKGSV